MKLITVIIALASLSFAFAQNRSIAFYNVENLFDTVDGENKDEEFLPNGRKEWDKKKYQEKIQHINSVMDILNRPILMGFCEVENKSVVEDILAYSPKRKGYKIVHFESTDARGIDVALTYDASVFTLNDSGFLRFQLELGDRPHTRDILWAKLTHDEDTIFAMVNHWPSRYGGQVASNPKRLQASSNAAEFIDSVQQHSPDSKIVFMGDLNDYPENMSVQMVAERLKPVIKEKSGEFGGTHNYRGEWGVLDHIFVSKNFTRGRNLKVRRCKGKIHSPGFLITKYKGNLIPWRTYGGGRYLGGYSDHLPVSVRVKMKE